MNDSNLHIVIAGIGLAGQAATHRLRKALPNAKITVIDGKKEHYYQPGYTLLATGVWKNAKKVIYDAGKLLPPGVNWIQSPVKAFSPETNTVLTENGESVNYDYLVVATGLRLGYDKIEGFDIDAVGQKGLGSVYASPQVALKTWDAMEAYGKTGGRAVMTLAPTFMKCAGAPLKMTFLVQDTLQRAGVGADRASIDFFAPGDAIFSVPWVVEDVVRRWSELPVSPQITYKRRLTAVDMDKKVATFHDPDGTQYQEDYDFLHVVPPMFAPDAVLNSDLSVKEGPQQGWLDVERYTLQHTRYKNVFGVGDVNGTPRGKTAATVKKSVPMVVHNLLQVINGKEPDQSFDGYTSCPLILRRGSAMLVEFDGDGNATPTIPGVNPLKNSYFAWYIEEFMLKPAYMAVLKGKVD